MKEPRNFPASDLARSTGDILDAASRAPVTITKHGKPRFILMSYEHYTATTGGGDRQDVPPDNLTNETDVTLDSPMGEHQDPAALPMKTVKLRVSFWIENNSKFVRGKKKTYEDIEAFVLYPYAPKRHRQGDYTITVEYHDDQDLSDIANAILSEIHERADWRNCFAGDEMVEVVGDPDRCWS